MGGPHYYITYYYYRRAIVFFCDTARLWRRGAVSSNMGLCQHLVYACAIILALWWRRRRFAANCANRYIYHELLSDCQSQSELGGWWQQAAGDRFCSGYLLLLGVKVRM